MVQLARLHDVGVVRLPAAVGPVPGVGVEQILALAGQRHDVARAVLVGDGVSGQQALFGQVPPVAVPRVLAVRPVADITG